MARKKAESLMQLRAIVEGAFERRASLTPAEIDGSTRPAVEQVMAKLEAGKLRVAEPGKAGWVVNEWLKKAVLLYFRCNDMQLLEGAPAPYWDKVPLQFEGWDEDDFRKLGA